MIFIGFEKTIFGNVKQKGGKLTQSAEAFVQPRHKECVGDTHPLACAFFNQLLFSLRVWSTVHILHTFFRTLRLFSRRKHMSQPCRTFFEQEDILHTYFTYQHGSVDGKMPICFFLFLIDTTILECKRFVVAKGLRPYSKLFVNLCNSSKLFLLFKCT